MSIIEATSVRVSTLADGTLRLVVDIDPPMANDAFSLFGAPGRAIALAALKDGHAELKDEPAPQTEEIKGGPLAKSAGIICRDLLFQKFAARNEWPSTEAGAREMILYACGVKSRRELDGIPGASKRYWALMMRFREWSGIRPVAA